MANCKFCNANIPDDSTFCPFCGKQMPLAPVQSAPVNQTPAAEEKPQPKKKKKKGGIIAAIIALLLVAGIGVAGFIFIDEIKELLGIETVVENNEDSSDSDEDKDDEDLSDPDEDKDEEGASVNVGNDEETKVVTDVETTAPVEVGLGNDILASEIEIDGVVYQLPCEVSDFVNNGWDYNSNSEYVDTEYYTGIYITKGDMTVDLTIAPSATPTLYFNGTVTAVQIYSGTASAELPGGIVMDAVYDGTDGGVNWDSISADEYQTSYSLASGNVNVIVNTDSVSGKVTYIYYSVS